MTGISFLGVVFPIFFFIMFGLVAVVICVTLVRGISTRHTNNSMPRLSVTARVVAKRADVSHHQHAHAGDMTGAHGYYTTTSTRYYATFDVETGDRFELEVGGEEYGLLVEEDYGRLTLQGKRFIGFERM